MIALPGRILEFTVEYFNLQFPLVAASFFLEVNTVQDSVLVHCIQYMYCT